jgi:O-antigen/teichoic acid export membrane protein
VTHTQPAKNSLFGNSLFIFLIRFFPALASLIVVVVFGRNLDAGVYGTYQNFWVQYYVLSAVSCMGLHVFMLTYSPAYLLHLLRGLSRNSLLLGIGWMVAVSAGMGLLQMAHFGFWMPFLFLLLFTFSTITEAFLMVCRAFKMLTAINIFFAIVFLLLHASLLYGQLTLSDLFCWITVLLLVRLLFYGVLLIPEIKKTVVTSDELHSLRTVRTLWLQMGAFDILQVMFRWADKFFISLLLGASVSAVYFNGSMEIPFLAIILGAVGSAGLIQLATAGLADKKAETVHMLHHSGKLLSVVVFPLFFFLLFFSPELFAVVFGHKYDAAVPVFLITIFAIPVRAYNFTTVLQHYHKGKIINIGAVADIVLACLLMYPLYLWLGLPGVALAFVVTTYLQAAFYLYHSAKALQMPVLRLIPLQNWLVKVIVFFSFFIILHYLLHRSLSEQMVLTWGIIALAAGSGAALWYELKTERSPDGKTDTA